MSVKMFQRKAVQKRVQISTVFMAIFASAIFALMATTAPPVSSTTTTGQDINSILTSTTNQKTDVQDQVVDTGQTLGVALAINLKIVSLTSTTETVGQARAMESRETATASKSQFARTSEEVGAGMGARIVAVQKDDTLMLRNPPLSTAAGSTSLVEKAIISKAETTFSATTLMRLSISGRVLKSGQTAEDIFREVSATGVGKKLSSQIFAVANQSDMARS